MIKVLHVDDDRFDLELVKFKLERVDKDLQIVGEGDSEAVVQRVRDEEFDAIICDYQMPGMNGLDVLKKLREAGEEIPFVFLTGQGNERLAVEALHIGADDYFTKEEGLAHYERLIHSLRSRVNAFKEARGQRRVEKALNAVFAETHLKTDREFLDALLLKLTEILSVKYALIGEIDSENRDVVQTLSLVIDGQVVDNITYELTGSPCENVIAQQPCVHESDVQNLFPDDVLLTEMEAESYIGVPLFRGSGVPLGIVALLDTKPLRQTRMMRALLLALSLRVSAEIERMHILRDLEGSEKRLNSVIDSMISGFALYEQISDTDTGQTDFRFLQVNKSFEKLIGVKADQVIRKRIRIVFPDIREDMISHMAKVVLTGDPENLTLFIETMNRHFEVRLYRPEPGLCATILNDVTDKVLAEKALKASERRFRDLFSEMMSGSALHEIICDEDGVPVDYRFLEVNEAFEKLTGLKAADAIGKTVRELIPEIEDFWIETYGRVALTGEPTQFSNFNATLNRHYEVRAYCPAPGLFAVIFNDVSEEVKAERALRESEHRFRALVELNVTGIFRSSIEGQMIDCNEALLKLLGFRSFEQIKNIKLEELYYNDSDRDITIQALKDSGRLKNHAVTLKTSSGEPKECIFNVQLIDDHYILGTVTEINVLRPIKS